MTKKLVFYFIYILLITQSIQSIGFGSEHDNSITLIILKNPSFDPTHSNYFILNKDNSSIGFGPESDNSIALIILKIPSFVLTRSRMIKKSKIKLKLFERYAFFYRNFSFANKYIPDHRSFDNFTL